MEKGKKLTQQTRSWNESKNITEVMRKKEEAHDYRYFPEPDLPPLLIADHWQKEVKKSLPELPDEKLERFMKDYDLSRQDAGMISGSRELALYFEGVVAVAKNAKTRTSAASNAA